jgi:chorismate synthase
MSAEVIDIKSRRKPRVDPMMLPAAFVVAYLAVAVVMIDIVRESFAGDQSVGSDSE